MRGLRRVVAVGLVVALMAPLASAAELSYMAHHPRSLGHQKEGDHERALHALNRLTFGPRPGEVERVAAMGVERWIEQQLNPRKTDDDKLEARLARYRSLKMNARELVEAFPPPQMLRAIAEGRQPMPSDPKLKLVYQAQIDLYRLVRERREQRREAQNQDDAPMLETDERNATPEQQAQRREARRRALRLADELEQTPPRQRFEAIARMKAEDRLALALGLPEERREALVSSLPADEQELLAAMVAPLQVAPREAQSAKLLRAIYSERQLEEVLTDFWFNHFNVFLNKGADRYLLTSYERDAIRPHVLGKFEDLLVATAKHPAMLFYLDNWQSVGPKSEAAEFAASGQMRGTRGRMGRRAMRRRGISEEQMEQIRHRMPRGLNENYARELMELHTLGVNGGYTQQDVTEVARVFTGWTIEQPRRGGDFRFNPRMHEPGDKTVLGQRIRQDGENEGVRVLEMLARHRATARFLSTKLAQRFVSDDAPQALVERMAKTYEKTGGDLREVMRTLLESPEFWASAGKKVKTPLEFVASAARAIGAEVRNPGPILQALNRMGMPLYGAQPPTGYSSKADAWVNSAALVSRLNFALALGTGRLRGVEVTGGGDSLDEVSRRLLGRELSAQTRQTIEKKSESLAGGASEGPNAGVLAGLVLGSPEFQRR